MLCEATGFFASFMWNFEDKPELSVPFGIYWHQLKFFTIWSNLLVLILSARMVINRRFLSAPWLAALTLWLMIVMVVWHLLLGNDTPPQGWNFVANSLMHTVNPLLMAVFWAIFAPKAGLTWRHAAIWLIWPLLYVIYAVTRGMLTGFYPYFFVNLDKLGWGGLLIWAAKFLIAFYLAGLGVVALGKFLGRRQSDNPGSSKSVRP